MTLRVLPRDEWALKLVGTELEATWAVLPDNAQVIVVEDGDRMLGCWSVYSQVHCEGLYIAPEYRKNPRVARRLLHGMINVALALGANTVQTAAISGEVVGLLEKIGATELPGRHFAMRIRNSGGM